MSEARQPVWGLPVRLFHWTLAALIGFSWWSAENHHLDWHLYSGLGILTLLFFRLFWGFFGSSTARWSSFVRGPHGVRAYLKDPKSWHTPGHTPLGALSVLAMLAAITVQVFLGLFSVDDDGLFEGPLARFLTLDSNELAVEIHESWFWVVVALVVLHVAAILYYKIVRKKPLTKAMITGSADLPEGSAPMRPGKWWVALLCLAAGIGLTRWIAGGMPPFGP